MSNKTCGECRYYEHPAGQCAKVIEYNNCHITDKACEYFERKPTNGDRVRQMSNRDLAELLDEVNCFYCPYENKKNGMCNRPDEKTCIDGIEEWLNAPAKEESEGEDE